MRRAAALRDPWAWIGTIVLIAFGIVVVAVFSFGPGSPIFLVMGGAGGFLYKKYRGPSDEAVDQAVQRLPK